MRRYEWRLYVHPRTKSLVRVHPANLGLAAIYERWGWVELL